MSDKEFSDEQLNAFVDKQLDACDRRRVLEALGHEPALQQRVSELQQLKHLLQHAYETPPPVAPSSPLPRARWRIAAGAAALVLFGLAGGWMLHSITQHFAAPKGVVIQVSENDPMKWQMALLNARNVRKAYADPKLNIEIVAYGPGLEMLRKQSEASAGLEEATRAGVKLLACGNTMSMTHTPRDALNNAVDVVPAGVVEIMQKQQAGYAYVRP